MLERLEEQDITLDDLREDISKSLVYNNYIQDQIGPVEVTEEELEEAYQAHQELTDEKLDEETKQLINNQLLWQKEEELRLELVENLKKECDIKILL